MVPLLFATAVVAARSLRHVGLPDRPPRVVAGDEATAGFYAHEQFAFSERAASKPLFLNSNTSSWFPGPVYLPAASHEQ